MFQLCGITEDIGTQIYGGGASIHHGLPHPSMLVASQSSTSWGGYVPDCHLSETTAISSAPLTISQGRSTGTEAKTALGNTNGASSGSVTKQTDGMASA